MNAITTEQWADELADVERIADNVLRGVAASPSPRRTVRNIDDRTVDADGIVLPLADDRKADGRGYVWTHRGTSLQSISGAAWPSGQRSAEDAIAERDAVAAVTDAATDYVRRAAVAEWAAAHADLLAAGVDDTVKRRSRKGRTTVEIVRQNPDRAVIHPVDAATIERTTGLTVGLVPTVHQLDAAASRWLAEHDAALPTLDVRDASGRWSVRPDADDVDACDVRELANRVATVHGTTSLVTWRGRDVVTDSATAATIAGYVRRYQIRHDLDYDAADVLDRMAPIATGRGKASAAVEPRTTAGRGVGRYPGWIVALCPATVLAHRRAGNREIPAAPTADGYELPARLDGQWFVGSRAVAAPKRETVKRTQSADRAERRKRERADRADAVAALEALPVGSHAIATADGRTVRVDVTRTTRGTRNYVIGDDVKRYRTPDAAVHAMTKR